MKQKTIVYVVNKKGKPFMPTTRCGHVHKLLKSGKAVAINNNPFTIKLKYDVPDGTQDIFFGLDTGRENIGAGASDEDGNCVYLSELKTSNKSVKKNMTSRAESRRGRRRHDRQSKQRKSNHDGTDIKNGEDDKVRTKHDCKSVKITYPGADNPVTHKVIQGKEGKFNNRRRDEDWITPSARQLVQMHINALKQVAEILPISHVSLERVAFDFQKLENDNIYDWNHGKLYGYDDYKDYINDEQHGKCLCCGKNDIKYYHHIIPRSKGGSDKVSNIAGLCWDCHYGPMGVHNCQETQDRLPELKGEANNTHKVSLLNSVMPALIKEIRTYCDAHGIEFRVTDGKETKATRDSIGIDKTHSVDGYCISFARRDIKKPKFIPDRIYEQQRFKKKSNNNINALNKREYWLDGKCVAIGRHKATDQKEDSLEEFLTVYRETHTEKEIQQMMHEIDIRPAKRSYTFHKYGRKCLFHIGDTIRFYKKNKINHAEYIDTFVCEGVNESAQKLKGRGIAKKFRFCSVLKAGCTPFVGFRKYSLI